MKNDLAKIIQRFDEGNARFFAARPVLPQEHAPIAAVLTCADARVDPTRIFAAEPGELFIVRNAGNVASEHALESLAFAAGLGIGAIIVLGHSDCGAVKDALQANPRLPASAAAIRVHLQGATDPDNAARAHAKGTAAKVARAIQGKVPVLAALYHTQTGEVEWLS